MSLILLFLLLPVILLIALIIRIDSPGNPFFLQHRVGIHGKRFLLFKFRTLYLHEFGIFPDEEIGFRDHRVTRFGKYLRATKLDEIPQLLNIMLGEMSMVGPRPDIPEQAEKYTDEQRKRLLVKPGLTGIAQISGNTDLSWAERIVMDLWYVDHWSIALDLKIIFFTPVAIIRGDSGEPDPLSIRSKINDRA